MREKKGWCLENKNLWEITEEVKAVALALEARGIKAKTQSVF